MISFTGVKISL